MPTSMNRRAILAGAAAVAVPVPALAVADPVYAAIAARKATAATMNNGCPKSDEVLDALIDADVEAIRVMLSTQPTTHRGLAALVRYVTECEHRGDNITEIFMQDDDGPAAPGRERTMGREVFFPTVLRALEQLASGA